MDNTRIKACVVIVILITFWGRQLFGAEYLPNSLNMPVREKAILEWQYSEILNSVKEVPLWPEAIHSSIASYRFTWIPAKGGEPAVIRLDRTTEGKWILTSKQHNHCSECKVGLNQRRQLTKGEIDKFQKLFCRLRFWQLSTVGALEAEDVLDGSKWVLEAIQNGRYHLIRRISPVTDVWITVPEEIQGFEKLRRQDGYPRIDRATSKAVNKRLVAVGEFLLKLSGIKLNKIN